MPSFADCLVHFYTFRLMFRATKALLRNLSTFKNSFAFFQKLIHSQVVVLNFIASALQVTNKKLVFLEQIRMTLIQEGPIY